MKVRVLKKEEADRWDATLWEMEDASIYQCAGWQRILERTYGHTTRYLVAEEQGTWVGVLPLLIVRSRLFGSYISSLPGGLCATHPDAATALLDHAFHLTDAQNADYLVLRDGRRHWPGRLICSERHCTLIRTLPDNPQTLWKKLPSPVRNRVRKAHKAGLHVIKGDVEQVPAFYSVFAHNMRDLGTPVPSARLLRNVLAEFQGQAQIFMVTQEEQPLGGMVLLMFKDTVYNPWVSSIRKYFALCPNDLLYWEALQWACQNGYRHFDFGRSQWATGTYRFKAKWGATPQPLHYQYYLRRGKDLPDPTLKLEAERKYQVARWMWQRLPVALTRLIGPPLVRYLNPLG